jgi:hypothetical protein
VQCVGGEQLGDIVCLNCFLNIHFADYSTSNIQCQECWIVWICQLFGTLGIFAFEICICWSTHIQTQISTPAWYTLSIEYNLGFGYLIVQLEILYLHLTLHDLIIMNKSLLRGF